VPSNRARPRLSVEPLEARLAMSGAGAVAGSTVSNNPTLDTLNAFTHVYLSRVGEPNYNPAFDLNHNGQIAQVDGRILLRDLAPLSPRIPISLNLTLAPQDKARGPVPSNSGGVTHHREPTILGHTTPGALVFTGSGTVDLKLHGPVVVADAQGNFSLKVTLADGINQFDFLAVDHFGQQTLRAFPIYWLDFAQYENAHPTKT